MASRAASKPSTCNVAAVEATGKGATCFASIVRGFRTPPGFKKLRWQREVNLDATSHPELDQTAA